jgi:hypothetical protein
MSMHKRPLLRRRPVRSLSENIAALTQRAASLLAYLDNEIISKLIGWFELLAWVFGNVLAGFAMLQVIREDNGEGPNLYWWFGRLGLFFVLSGTSLAIINTMSTVGYEIANGNESTQQSVLHNLYLAQRDSFDESYAKFQQNMFTVKVDDRETAIDPDPLGSVSVLGIIVDTESTIKDFERKADVSVGHLYHDDLAQLRAGSDRVWRSHSGDSQRGTGSRDEARDAVHAGRYC